MFVRSELSRFQYKQKWSGFACIAEGTAELSSFLVHQVVNSTQEYAGRRVRRLIRSSMLEYDLLGLGVQATL
jgi:hypothetical protein